MAAPPGKFVDVFVKLLNALECPVCYEYVSSPIYQCVSGHALCRNCKVKIKRCPVCRGDMTLVRARSLEGIADVMLYPCRNNGCEEILSQAAMKDHLKNCTYATSSSDEDGELTRYSYFFRHAREFESFRPSLWPDIFSRNLSSTSSEASDPSLSTDSEENSTSSTNESSYMQPRTAITNQISEAILSHCAGILSHVPRAPYNFNYAGLRRQVSNDISNDEDYYRGQFLSDSEDLSEASEELA